MTTTRYLSLVLFLAPLAACSTPEAHANPNRRLSTADDQALCTQVFQRARTCTDSYIPALVDARARHDRPAGIAEAVKNDRDGVIAQAKAEWAGDSTDAAITASCGNIVAGLTDDDRGLADDARACVAQADCGAFTTCIMPIFEKHFAK